MRLMCDIMALAFQTEATRVCSLKLNNDHSYLRFSELYADAGHHELSHRNDDAYLRVNQFFLEQFGYIARQLNAVQEGERTALDNSILSYCSSMMTGDHNAKQLPVVLLCSGGGQIETGRVLDYLDKPHRQMCNLYLSLMDKFDVRLKTFSDSTQRLAEI